MLFSKKDLIRLILPMMARQVLAITVGTADSMMVASAGEAAVSGVALSGELDALHGRFVHAARDDVDRLLEVAADIDAADARTLRLRTFGPDDPLADR